MPQALVTRAPAKVNLTLHILGRRRDGYHELESLVAFSGGGDTLALDPGPDLALLVEGPTAQASGPEGENLVLKAAQLLAGRRPGLKLGAFRLVKRLPVAAGLGGGSSDAAAALRLLARLNGLESDHPDILAAARGTGADVPVCLGRTARMMRGAGERLGAPVALPPLFVVLLNPGVPVETREVFGRLGLSPGQDAPGAPHPTCGSGLDRDAVVALLARARNDLETPAAAIAPAIAEALASLRADPRCRLARMSGSGATVFGIFGDCREAASAAAALRRPGWWAKATVLR